jgi:iron complex transport system substrate-binding protein
MRDARILSPLIVFIAVVLGSLPAGAKTQTPGPALRADRGDERVSVRTEPTIEVIDAAGRVVRLAKTPERIVVIGKGPHFILHLLYMFPEGRERLVGMERRGKTASEFLDLIDPGFRKKGALGVAPGPEAIAALHPDLVLAKGSSSERMSEVLAGLGIPFIYLSLETPEEFFRDTSNLGLILQNEARAAEILAFFRSRIERVRSALSGIASERKPRVLLALGTDRGGKYSLQVPAASWMQTIQVRTAGGIPVWLDVGEKTAGWIVVNLEQIARWDADKAFIVVWYSNDRQKMLDALKSDPQWKRLKAVRNGELYAFPSDIFGWDSPDPRWILGLTWLAVNIHPDVFKGIDMTAEISAFYDRLYGLDRRTIDELLLPRVKMDVR